MKINVSHEELSMIIQALVYLKADYRDDLAEWKPDPDAESIDMIMERCLLIERYNACDNLKKKLESIF